jgi:hypothetical protein
MLPENSPDRIGHYELKGLLATGGMGRVYLARDIGASGLVVVKVLDTRLDATALRQRFEPEARALASLDHPHIVRVHESGDFRGSPFLAMDYVRGETLEEKVKRRAAVSLSQKLKWLVELCAGLAYAHDRGLVHGDVKSANLMVEQDERLRILDFGLARLTASAARVSPLDGGPVQTGTAGYMSPEQAGGGAADVRSDIFAVGAVSYYLFAFQEAFEGQTPAEIENKVLRSQPQPLLTRLPGFDAEISAIVARALARNPSDRYQDASALREAFERCRARIDPSAALAPMARPSGVPAGAGGGSAVRAGAAYVRAIAAYKDQALGAARRFGLEALAEDPEHTGARALLARIEPGRWGAPGQRTPAASRPTPQPAAAKPSFWDSGFHKVPPTPPSSPEVASFDPTILISPAGHREPPTAIEPTMIIRRDAIPGFSARPDETVAIPTSAIPRPVEPPAPSRPSSKQAPLPPPARRSAPRAAFLLPIWQRMKGIGGHRRPSAPPTARGSRWTPSAQGMAMAVAALVVAAILVFGAIVVSRSIWTSGQSLTLTRPTGGTIVGAGLQCGTRGSDCSTTRPDNDAVEFQAVADAGYVFTAFTGDCAPTGRLVMAQARTCGASFDKVAEADSAVTWPLTITKPTGGTIVAAGGILCGSLGTQCSATLPDGVPVTLHVEPDANYTFLNFTDDCAAKGDTTMTAARTCGATFAPSAARVRVDPPAGGDQPRNQKKPVVVVEAEPPAQAVPPVPAPAGQNPTSGSPPPPIVPADKVERPITAEEHAQAEIEQLLKNYCGEYETLKPDRIQKLFHLEQRSLRDQFKEYKSLRCTITTDKPKFPVLSISPNGGAGSAQVLFDMKQVIEMKSGGAPKTIETNVTMYLSRAAQRDDWLIDRVLHVPKPKP